MRNYQTLTFIRTELARRGLRPITGLGQHFLIDGNLLRLMVEEAEVGEGDLVLEIGAGTGSLTELLAQRAGHVVAAELDARLLEVAQELVGGSERVTFWQGDVLADKHTLNPDLVGLINDLRSRQPHLTLKMVSDLPYKVATPVIMNLWESGLPVELMLVTIQWELAEKLVAEPRTKPYGALTVKVAVWARSEVVRRLPPSVFWPRPAVDSAFVRMRRRPEPALSGAEYRGFADLVGALFQHRRKTVARALGFAARDLGLGGPEGPGTLPGGLGSRRVDQLTLEEFLRIWQALRGRARPEGSPDEEKGS